MYPPPPRLRFEGLLVAVGLAGGLLLQATQSSGQEERREAGERPYWEPGTGEAGGGSTGPWSGWSEPSECSRDCGGGVSLSQRECLAEGACTGGSKRYYSCNIQDCPPGSEDFRAQQCAVYNDVEFEGQYYQWVPYRKAANKCQLNCMPKGERFYYRHQDKVIDGTPCTEDSLDVCIDGECVGVGCDRVLGSKLREDVCRVCGGDGSSCTTTSGSIDTDDLVSGYNDLLLIPEGATNIKVSERNPSSNYLAIRNKTGHYYLNGNWRIDFPRSLRFAGTTFSYTRQPFGFWAPETITALGPTSEAIFIVLLYQERNPGIDYSYSVPKGTVHETSAAGYSWFFGDWSPCNTSCGSGYQTRNVGCSQRDSSEPASEDLCDPSTRPSWIQPCSLQACPPSWSTGAWSACSVSCGSNGTQTRQVYCTQDDGSGRPTLVKDDSACLEAGPKPASVQPCGGDPVCPVWHLGPWKPCDRLCGPGKETRELHCIRKTDDGKVSLLEESECGAERPEAERPCELRPCEGLDWITGDWSGCEGKCGLSFETRTAYCGNQNGIAYPDELCHAYRKPELVRNCTYTPCASQWYTSQWSACSAKCGVGIQTRSVFCAAFEGDLLKKVPDTNCDPQQKYAEQQECRVEAECKGEWFYGPFSACSKPCGGGVMSRKILCTKNNTQVDLKECSVDTIGSSTMECNLQPCGEDEIIPVEPTQMISEEYSEECEEGDYDYDFEDESFIKVPSEFGESTSDDLGVTDKDLLSTMTGVSEEDEEGSGGLTEDFITVSPKEGSSPESSTIFSILSSIGSSIFTSEPSVSQTSSSSMEESISSTVPSASYDSSSSVGLESSSVGLESSSDGLESSSESGTSPGDILSSSGIPDSSAGSSTESSISEGLPSSTVSSDSSSGSSSEDVTLASSSSPETSSSSDDSSSDPTSPSPESSSSDATSDTTSDSTTEADTSSDSSLVPSSIGVTDSSESSPSPESSTPESSSPESSSNSAGLSDSTDFLSDGPSSSEQTIGDYEETSKSSTIEGATSVSPGISSDSSDSSLLTSPAPSDSSSTSSDLESTSPSSSSEGSSVPVSTDSSISSSPLSLSTDLSSSTSGDFLSSSPEETSEEIETTSYSEALFGVTTSSPLDKAVKKEQKMKQCKRRKRSKCTKSEFGCCSDNRTPAKGPFAKDCPMPKTCMETEFGCCPDGVSPAKGPKKRSCSSGYCEGTLFGCCPDRITPAMGYEFEGCPIELTTFTPDCASSEFGCCPDGIIAATGPNEEGCAGCGETEFGCCPDGVSTALGSDNFGCDIGASTTLEPGANVTSECDNSTHGCCPDGLTPAEGPDEAGCPCTAQVYGCCPDGKTPASGPDNEGCPVECSGGEFGCCDDNVTLAHGPNKEGCCLLSVYGCCPDNILSARGPNREGCGCIYSPYGCCPNNRTAARGPDNEGCGCQYTEHGCCPNRYTPAAGPDFQGCPCHTFQFGCCPDGVTTAIGPHLQGCGCDNTEFGCCSDGRTPAPDASKNCTCAATKFGCCLDGVTPAQGEDFEGCSAKLVYKGEYCTLGKKIGECRNLTIKWYFDMEYGGCSRFWYGGCGGNGNKFTTSEECKETCVEAKGKDRCYLPKIEGPCKSYYPRWYYDKDRKSCSQFVYSGCLGNTNRFETRDECEELCGTQQHLDACEQKMDGGPCEGNYTRWYFDKDSESCLEFDYGGCKGTQNNFLSESACKVKCLQPGKSREECSLPREQGTCDSKEPRWYFDFSENKCLPFHFSGCGGNGNNFNTRDECEEACPPRIELDTCLLPAVEGNCHNYTERYFYDVMRKTCRQFYYGGCGGNNNNFLTEVECKQRCDPSPETPLQFQRDMCFLGSDEGSCSGSEIKWFYNSQDGTCRQFKYTGCAGNGNRFESQQHCEQSCADVQDVCELPRVVGPCDGTLRQWHYDRASGTCIAFDYSGCQGNGNRFDTEAECRARCASSPAQPPPPRQPLPPAESFQDICYLSSDPGPCLQQIPAWAYNPSTGSCEQFNYGGCEGNANRFGSEEQCERQCGQFKGQDPCFGDMEMGTCFDGMESSPQEKFFYDTKTKSCSQFDYSGCGGNPNRFSTVEECESLCLNQIEPPIPNGDNSPAVHQAICSLPMESGVCDGALRRWYYESRRRSCTQFIYTGCGGNLNNFPSFQECNDFCLPAPVRQPPPSPRENEIQTRCEDTERRCASVTGCRYGLEQWVDSSGCTACRCHEPCYTSPPSCPPGQSCQVSLEADPQTGLPQYRPICAPDTKPGECGPVEKVCRTDCQRDSDCQGEQKCCATGCGSVCSPPQPPTTQLPPRMHQASEAPTISDQTPSDESSPEGNFVTFNCIAQGRPRPTVTWYKDSTPLEVNEAGSGRFRVLENGTLQVIGLEKSDSGLYTCRASNGISPDAARDYSLTVTVPVGVDLSPPPTEIKPGSNVTLTCSTRGFPLPQISWYWKGSVVQPNQRISISGNKLTIYDAQVEDSGEYTCIAANDISSAQTSAVINVRGMRLGPDCTDSPFLANCKLIIKARYCNHKFYAKFCCKSCTEAGQLPLGGISENLVRRRRHILLRIPNVNS